jgi:hypothetical protein
MGPFSGHRKRAEEVVHAAAETAAHEIKAAEETIWHALEAVGSLLGPGHRQQAHSRFSRR